MAYFWCSFSCGYICLSISLENMSTGRGGAREGAGRKRTSLEGTVRKSRTLRASDSEWETIKDFARILKHDPERAAKLVAGLGNASIKR